jgi:hypothetical protein
VQSDQTPRQGHGDLFQSALAQAETRLNNLKISFSRRVFLSDKPRRATLKKKAAK